MSSWTEVCGGQKLNITQKFTRVHYFTRDSPSNVIVMIRVTATFYTPDLNICETMFSQISTFSLLTQSVVSLLSGTRRSGEFVVKPRVM